MRDVDALLRTISTIYSVPGSEDRWSGMVGEIAHLVGAAAGVYMLISEENQRIEMTGLSGYPAEVARRYEGPEGFIKDIRVAHKGNLIPGKVFREFEFVPDRAAYAANEWIRYQREALGHFWCMAARVSTHGLWSDYISLNRLHSRGPHTDEEKADLQALLPHLARAAELHRVVSRLEDRYGAVLAMLDKLLVGLVILDLNGRVAVVNSAARSACDASGVLQVGAEGHLRARHPRDDASLRALISRASMTADGRDQSDGGSLVVEKRGQAGSLLIEVVPLRDDGFSDGDNIRGTAIFIIDPASPHKLSVDGLSRIFKLTSSEHSVTDLLVNGADVREVAESRGTSTATVRSQLKQIFLKTGAVSQLELVRLAVKANPPIEGL
jgi:DNA-binding CsgD family transcriptional regulator